MDQVTLCNMITSVRSSTVLQVVVRQNDKRSTRANVLALHTCRKHHKKDLRHENRGSNNAEQQ